MITKALLTLRTIAGIAAVTGIGFGAGCGYGDDEDEREFEGYAAPVGGVQGSGQTPTVAAPSAPTGNTGGQRESFGGVSSTGGFGPTTATGGAGALDGRGGATGGSVGSALGGSAFGGAFSFGGSLVGGFGNP